MEESNDKSEGVQASEAALSSPIPSAQPEKVKKNRWDQRPEDILKSPR